MGVIKKLSSAFIKLYNVKIKDVVVDHHKYLGKRNNSLKIYESSPKNMIFSPFNITTDHIDRLILINFEEDPIYYAIELQIFCIAGEKLPMVIMYRKDDLIDIYYTNEAIIEYRKKLIENLLTNVSFNQLEEIDFRFQTDDMGLDAYLFLKDKLEKNIEFKIKENTPGRELTAMLTPIGAASKKPQYFPIVYLNKFGMVIKKDTEIFINIHGVLRKPVEMPFRMNGMYIYLARYSLEPIISNWNNAYSGCLNSILIDPANIDVKNENLSYKILNNGGYYEIKKISGKDEFGHTISFEFSPAIPNLITLKSNVNIKGKFSCCIDDRKGIFAGEFYINRVGDIISFSIQPIKGWQPFPGKIWLKTYKWNADIDILEKNNIRIQSNWYRI
ncbi:MAG: hypothetical protein CEE42_14655 [Promethearchaeota archaeon Loki_b31]|nr:MAG: hypothetical protein CEE42_14655 [Candidatus Lokiarchaeota archaeon Loki_b31]